MKSIIEREATFENNSDMEVKVTQKQLSQAFVKETQWSKTTKYNTLTLCYMLLKASLDLPMWIPSSLPVQWSARSVLGYLLHER